MSTSNAIINAVNAKSQGEISAHLSTRAEFLRLVAADSRTRNLYGRWRRESALDPLVVEWATQLDWSARRLGVPHRSALRNAALYDAIPRDVRRFYAECEVARQERTAKTLTARARDAKHFCSRVLYPHPPPIRGWLGLDLLRIFDAEILRDVWGDPALDVPVLAGTVDADALKRGQRPMHDGEHLERNAAWYYRARVQVPPTSVEDLAREDVATKGLRAQRDDAGINDRPDTKLVRVSIAEAWRLLTLPIPPEQWSRYLQNQA